MAERHLTRRTEPWLSTSFRWRRDERDLLYLAAARIGISQNDFVRRAVIEKAEHILQAPNYDRILDPEDLRD